MHGLASHGGGCRFRAGQGLGCKQRRGAGRGWRGAAGCMVWLLTLGAARTAPVQGTSRPRDRCRARVLLPRPCSSCYHRARQNDENPRVCRGFRSCAGEDLNLHALAGTRPSTLRVYQFRHQREGRAHPSRFRGRRRSPLNSVRSICLHCRYEQMFASPSDHRDASVQLTKRQQEILRVVQDHIARHGYPPTVREIGDAVGLTSSSTVHAHLQALESRGALKRDPTKPRAIDLRERQSTRTERRRRADAAAGRRHRRRLAHPGGAERRGGDGRPGHPHHLGRVLPAPGARRVDDPRRHPRRRLRRRPPPAPTAPTATSWPRWSTAARPPSSGSTTSTAASA